MPHSQYHTTSRVLQCQWSATSQQRATLSVPHHLQKASHPVEKYTPNRVPQSQNHTLLVECFTPKGVLQFLQSATLSVPHYWQSASPPLPLKCNTPYRVPHCSQFHITRGATLPVECFFPVACHTHSATPLVESFTPSGKIHSQQSATLSEPYTTSGVFQSQWSATLLIERLSLSTTLVAEYFAPAPTEVLHSLQSATLLSVSHYTYCYTPSKVERFTSSRELKSESATVVLPQQRAEELNR